MTEIFCDKTYTCHKIGARVIRCAKKFTLIMIFLAKYLPHKKYLVANFLPPLLILMICLLPLNLECRKILLLTIIASILLLPDCRSSLRSVLYTPWVLSALGLFGLSLIACLWSYGDLETKGFVLEKYNKLLLLPILIVGFRERWIRYMSLYGFLITMMINCIASILQYYELFPVFSNTVDGLFYDHITTGFMMAFAAYLAAALGFKKSKKFRWYLVHFGFVVIFSYQILFINDGRTGYVIYLFLGMLFFIQYCTWRQTIIGLSCFLLIFSLSYFHSPIMQQRIHDLINENNAHQLGKKNTSTSYRLQAYSYSWQLINRHPLFGNGTGSFLYLARKKYPMTDNNMLEPHNQYCLATVEFGVVGLVVLLTFFGTLLWGCYYLQEMRLLAIATILSFMLGNLIDSLLYFFSTGCFFISMMALYFGEYYSSIEHAEKNIIN